MANAREIERRFRYHQPSDETITTMEGMRGHYWALADEIDESVPDGREKSLALTHLEQAHFYTNSALARPAA